MFFILSGLSMAAAYRGFVHDGRTAIAFFIRRVFRIWPLLWIAVLTVTIAGVTLKGQPIEWALVLLNLTTLFGFVSPGAYLNTGAWSIGNEMVYYALTPAILVAFDRRIAFGNVMLSVSVAIELYFSFFALSAEKTLAEQWSIYINPFNNFYLYITGVALYYNTAVHQFGRVSVFFLFLASLGVFLFYPVDGDLIRVVTGIDRIAFTVASVALVLAFYKFPVSLPNWLSRPLSQLGIATYGVYLLHPIVFQAVELGCRVLGLRSNPFPVMALTTILTVMTSLMLYDRVEAPFIRFGKKLTNRSAGITQRVEA
jgi:peptidoglycan/LPS O-acetylase OafA/YrhL